jgi:hypothetical protein
MKALMLLVLALTLAGCDSARTTEPVAQRSERISTERRPPAYAVAWEGYWKALPDTSRTWINIDDAGRATGFVTLADTSTGSLRKIHYRFDLIQILPGAYRGYAYCDEEPKVWGWVLFDWSRYRNGQPDDFAALIKTDYNEEIVQPLLRLSQHRPAGAL